MTINYKKKKCQRRPFKVILRIIFSSVCALFGIAWLCCSTFNIIHFTWMFYPKKLKNINRKLCFPISSVSSWKFNSTRQTPKDLNFVSWSVKNKKRIAHAYCEPNIKLVLVIELRWYCSIFAVVCGRCKVIHSVKLNQKTCWVKKFVWKSCDRICWLKGVFEPLVMGCWRLQPNACKLCLWKRISMKFTMLNRHRLQGKKIDYQLIQHCPISFCYHRVIWLTYVTLPDCILIQYDLQKLFNRKFSFNRSDWAWATYIDWT